MKATLYEIEVLTKAWNTVGNMFIRDDEELSKKQQVVLHKLSKRLIEKVDLYLKSGEQGVRGEQTNRG